MGTDSAIDIAARISGATTDIASRMTGAIRDAARQTGAGFEYLLNTAIRESNLNPNAKAKTSSATGLFQFIDQTWLGTMKQSGASLGYGRQADAITRTPQGKYVVNDPAMRNEIFALRKDASANAKMAGAFANTNAKFLKERLGRTATDGELYMAHFLGASGAARFISAAEANPNGKAASLFPRAAAANSSIFYDRQGGAKSLKQVYAGLVAKHDVIGNSRFAAARPVEGAKPVQQAKAVQQPNSVTETAAATMQKLATLPLALFRDAPAVKAAAPTTTVAAVTPSSRIADAFAATEKARSAPIPPRRAVAPATRVADAFAAAGATHTPAVAPAKAVAPAARATEPTTVASATTAIPDAMAFAPEPVAQSKSYPMFQTLFHENQRGAVAPVVRELWGARGLAGVETPTAVAPVGATVAPVGATGVPVGAATGAPAAPAGDSAGASANKPLDLFNFLRPAARRPA
jgi:hypothetical protein